MLVINMRLPTLLFALCSFGLAQAEPQFESIFDGESLTGWKAPNMSYWSVQDGAITGESTPENPGKKNQFLVWQGGEIGNFVLKLQFRMMGGPKANSGIQVRSAIGEDGHAIGYQADISQPDAQWLGAIYDEHGRKVLALRGQKTVIQADGTKATEAFATPVEAAARLNIAEWTDYEVAFSDNKMTVKVGGRLMSEITDLQESEREMSGILALQLHSGPPMKVQFKDIQLKQLP